MPGIGVWAVRTNNTTPSIVRSRLRFCKLMRRQTIAISSSTTEGTLRCNWRGRDSLTPERDICNYIVTNWRDGPNRPILTKGRKPMTRIALPTTSGGIESYKLRGEPLPAPSAKPAFNRVAYAAAHVVVDPVRRQRSLARRRLRLGADARLPPPSLGSRLRRRRGHGHRAARHGPRLGGRAASYRSARSPRRKTRPGAGHRLRRRHRPSRARPRT